MDMILPNKKLLKFVPFFTNPDRIPASPIPIACGMQVGRSYKAVMIIGVITALVTTVIGLTLSYYVGLKPGGTIVLLEVVCFLILALISRYTK